VVDAGIEADFGQDQHALATCVTVEIADLVVSIGRRDHRAPDLDALQRDGGLEARGEQIHHQIRALDLGREQLEVVDVEFHRAAAVVTSHATAGGDRIPITDDHEPIVLVSELEQVMDQVRRACPRTEHEDALHVGSPYSGSFCRKGGS
jgi:hypothetical protein